MIEDPDKKPGPKEETPGEPEVSAQGDTTAENESTDSGATDGAPEAAGEEPEADPETQLAELNDKLLRAFAELENYRRRAEKERQDTAKFAIAGFARDYLTVLDNLRRGLDSVSAEDRAGNQALEALAAGMELIERELVATLERHGIQKIDPLGEPFDYHRHQAMFEVEDESQPAGAVVQVLQTGYMLNERLLRPAMVGIAKGGPKPDAVKAKTGKEDSAWGGKTPQQDAVTGGEAGNDNQDGENPADEVEGDVNTNT